MQKHRSPREARRAEARAPLSGGCADGAFPRANKAPAQWAAISYTNASFPDDVSEFAVAFDAAVFANAKARAARILTATAPDQLKPEGWITGGRECRFCPFTTACGIVRHAVPTRPSAAPPDPQFIAETVGLARAAKAARREVENATAVQRDIEHQIRERLRSRDLRHVAGNGVTITWSPVKGRPSFDMQGIREAAAAAGIDLAQYETVGEPTDRLVIHVVEQSGSAA